MQLFCQFLEFAIHEWKSTSSNMGSSQERVVLDVGWSVKNLEGVFRFAPESKWTQTVIVIASLGPSPAHPSKPSICDMYYAQRKKKLFISFLLFEVIIWHWCISDSLHDHSLLIFKV